MKKFPFTYAILLAAMFLFNFSCEDHVVPEEPEEPEVIMPAIQTPGVTVENSATNLYRLKVKFTNLGNTPITEHGVVYSIEPDNGNQNFTNTPTIANSKTSFPTAPTLNDEMYNITELDLSNAKQLYYRAYAIYGKNQVVYGEVLVYDPKLAIIEALFDLPLTKPYVVGYGIQDLGKTPVKEYGMAYSYRTQPNGNINAFPTKANNFTVAPASPAMVIGLGQVTLPISDNSVLEIYARTYIEYQNGVIKYGNSILHAK